MSIADRAPGDLLATMGLIQTYPTLRQVLTIPAPFQYVYLVQGKVTATDGNIALFAWSPNAADADDNDTVLRPNDRVATGGRWKSIRAAAVVTPSSSSTSQGKLVSGAPQGFTAVGPTKITSLTSAAIQNGTGVTADATNKRLTANTTGNYLVSYWASWNASGADDDVRLVTPVLQPAGTAFESSRAESDAEAWTGGVTFLVAMTAGQYIELFGEYDGAGTVDIGACSLAMVGPL